MTSLLRSHFEEYVFLHHILVFSNYIATVGYIQKHITAVGS